MLSYQKIVPECGEGVFIADGAFVIGKVKIGSNSSVFYNSVVRGDVNEISIGAETNIQDNCTLHVTNRYSLTIGNGVTVGHNVVLHGCTIGDNVLVGIGAIVLDDAIIGDNSVVAAGSLVPPGKKIPPNSLIMGSPAKVVRSLGEEDFEKNRMLAATYLVTKQNHLTEVEKAG